MNKKKKPVSRATRVKPRTVKKETVVKIQKVKTEDKKSKIEEKIEKIKKSSLPASQKQEMISRLSKVNVTQRDRVSFSVYANLRNIKDGIRSGMVAFAKHAKMASIQEWDEIFKDF